MVKEKFESKNNVKSIRQDFKNKGVFYTDVKLAELMKSYIDINVNEVYDPTCGDGSLLSVFNDSVIKYGQEIDEKQLNIAEERLTNFIGFYGDTLTSPALKDKKFKCIMANPPFSIKWNPENIDKQDNRFNNIPALPPKSRADYAFILHILNYLDDDGIALCLCFPGILYRGSNEGKIRRWIIENNFIEKVIRIPAKSFIDTSIETCLLIFKKNKEHTDIEFIDGDKIHIASIKDVIENDYSLSFNNYIKEKEEIKEKINPFSFVSSSHNTVIQSLESFLSINQLVSEIENWNFKEISKKLEEDIKLIFDKYK